MNRLLPITTVAERTLLAISLSIAAIVHGGGMAAHALALPVLLQAFLVEILPAVQLILLLAWAVLGPGPLWVRVVGGAVLFSLWGTQWGQLAIGRNFATFGSLMIKAAALSAVAVMALRVCRFRIRPAPSARFDVPGRAQFSLRALVTLTTVIAVVLGLLEWFRPFLNQSADWQTYFGSAATRQWLPDRRSATQSIMATALAAVSVAALWCTLRPGLVWPRASLLLLLGVLLGGYLAHVEGGNRGRQLELGLAFALLAATVAITLLPLRLWNLRLLRRGGALIRFVNRQPHKKTRPRCRRPFAETIP
jgi:hypothetical protein